MDKIKVAMIAPESFPVPPVRGGAVESVIYQVAGFLGSNISLSVLSVADTTLPLTHVEGNVEYLHVQREGTLWREKVPLRLAKLPFKLPLRCYRSSYISAILSKLETLDPDIVHIHNSPLYVLFIKDRFPEMKVILHMHNRHLVRMNRKLATVIAKKADILAGVSQYIVKDILSVFPWASTKCRCLYNGVDINIFKPKWEIDIQKKRNQLGIEKSASVLLFAGRITKQKGIHVLLEALSRDFPPGWSLVVAGSSWFGEQKTNKYMRQIKKLAATIQNPIVFTGYVQHSEMPVLLAIADVAILPSIGEEAFPLIALETASVGTPILCNSIGGAAESVIDNKTGFVNKDISPEGLQQKLQAVYSLSKEQLENVGFQARKHISDQYSWPVCAGKYQIVYEELVKYSREKEGSYEHIDINYYARI